jgi:hypothetical protein
MRALVREGCIEKVPHLTIAEIRKCHSKQYFTRLVLYWYRGGWSSFVSCEDITVAGPTGPQPIYIEIEWTACSYGGSRPWFVCPVEHVDGHSRRTTKLYEHEGTLQCRKCCKLRYRSQYDAMMLLEVYRAKAIHSKLGGSGAISDPFPDRPKWMHDSTYRKLHIKYSRHLSFVCSLAERSSSAAFEYLDASNGTNANLARRKAMKTLSNRYHRIVNREDIR